MGGRHCVKLPQADPLTVNGHRHMLILVGVDSDDQLNTTTTFMTDDSCHFYLPEDCAPAGERTRLRWGVGPGSYKVTARLAEGTSGATSNRVDGSG